MSQTAFLIIVVSVIAAICIGLGYYAVKLIVSGYPDTPQQIKTRKTYGGQLPKVGRVRIN